MESTYSTKSARWSQCWVHSKCNQPVIGSHIVVTLVLSKRWYILHYHRNTLLLPLRGEVVAEGGRVEERSEVIYWHRMNTVIYYMYHNSHSCIV